MNNVAKIKVIGVGGAGNNAVNRMVEENVQGVEFYIANTDEQVLINSPVANKIPLGINLAKGLGAGANPDLGRKAAMESEDTIRKALEGADMVFITAGLGGGTGTGASPVIAKIAKEQGALVVGIVTKPFKFEGPRRGKQAEEGLEELKQFVDSVIIVSNNKVLEVIGNIPIKESFREADNVLRQGVQTITDLISVPAMINLDFADVRSVMANQGGALIGIGSASGGNKAFEAAQKAISSPLLEARVHGAKNAIVNVTGGHAMSIQDASDAVEFIRESAGNDIDIIFGVSVNENLKEEIVVTIIATGFEDVEEVVAPTQPFSHRNVQPREVAKVEPARSPLHDTGALNLASFGSVKEPVHASAQELAQPTPEYFNSRQSQSNYERPKPQYEAKPEPVKESLYDGFAGFFKGKK